MSDSHITRGELDIILNEELEPIREHLRSVATHDDLRSLNNELAAVRGVLDGHNITVVGLLRGREKEMAIAGEQRRKTVHLLVDRLTAPLADWRVMLGLVALAAIALAGGYGLTIVTDYGSVGSSQGAPQVESSVSSEASDDGDAESDSVPPMDTAEVDGHRRDAMWVVPGP